MTTKQYVTIAIAVLIVVLSLLVYFLFKRLEQISNENDMWQENFRNEMFEQNKQIILKNEKQLERLFPRLDSVAKANGIKNITEIHNTYYTYNMDTLIVPMQQPDSTKPYFLFSVDTACLSISGAVDVPLKRISFSHISLSDTITTFYYKIRQKLFDWKWTPRWGKWQYQAKTVSNCTDSIKTENIKINKKMKHEN